MQFLVKIVKDCESRSIFRTRQNIKMELFAEKFNGFPQFIIFVKNAILDVLNTFWILNTVLNMSLEALNTFARSFILSVWLGFKYVSDIKLYSRLGETLNQIIYSNGCWEVFLRKSALGNLNFLKHILEISYCNKDNITAKYRIGVILKTWKLRNDF